MKFPVHKSGIITSNFLFSLIDLIIPMILKRIICLIHQYVFSVPINISIFFNLFNHFPPHITCPLPLPGLAVRSESRIMDDDIMPAAMESELYSPSSMNQSSSSQAVIVNEPKDNSGCLNKFKAGIRGKIIWDVYVNHVLIMVVYG